MKIKDIKNWNNNFNQDNLVGFEARSQAEYRKQADADKSYDYINKLDWNKESDYHNSYRVNGKYVKGRAIILSKKK